MLRILKGTSLYRQIRSLSTGSDRIWIASPHLGRDAHNIFDASFQTAKDTRLLLDVRSGAVDRKELERLLQWAPDRVRTLRGLRGKMYIFDLGAIVTSANLSLPAFERNHEIGILYRGEEANKVRQVFSTWYSNGSIVHKSDAAKLPPRKRTVGDVKGAGINKHTAVDIWDTVTPDQLPRLDGLVPLRRVSWWRWGDSNPRPLTCEI